MASRQNTSPARSVKDAPNHNDNVESGTPDDVAGKPRAARDRPAKRLPRPKANDRKGKVRRATPHAADADGASTTRSATTARRIVVEGTPPVDGTDPTITDTMDTRTLGTATDTLDTGMSDIDRPLDGCAMLDAISLGMTFRGLMVIDPLEPPDDLSVAGPDDVCPNCANPDCVDPNCTDPDGAGPRTDARDPAEHDPLAAAEPAKALAATLAAHLSAFERALAPRFGLPVPPRPPELSAELCERIERSAHAAAGKVFDRDPLFDPAMSRLISQGASHQRRDGHFAHQSMTEALEQNRDLRVISDRKCCRIEVTKGARKAAGDVSFSVCQALDYPPDEPVGRPIVTDLVVIDRSTGEAIAIESKRGGQLGRGKRDTLISDVAITSLVLKEHLAGLKENVVHGEAYVLVHHDDRGLTLPGGMAITVDDLDDRFGTSVRVTTLAARRYHAALVRRAMLPSLVRALVEAMAATGRAATEPPTVGALPNDRMPDAA